MKAMNKKILAIGFDWDGTLVDSMIVKSQSFAKSIIAFYPKCKTNITEIKKIYLTARGNPRTHQLDLVQKKFNLKPLSEKQIQEWSDLFTSLYIDKKLPLFSQTTTVLSKLKKRGYKLFLCSSVPQQDLNKTLKMYPLKNYFECVLGARDGGKFRKGVPHFTYVSEKINIPLSRIAFVGDGADDVKGANETGCISVGIANPKIPNSKEEIQQNKPTLIIQDIKELLLYFT
jgi:phosphoglycolate phosphatase-like HAD superfamily hydrolase